MTISKKRQALFNRNGDELSVYQKRPKRKKRCCLGRKKQSAVTCEEIKKPVECLEIRKTDCL